jgi:hypothetical protein
LNRNNPQGKPAGGVARVSEAGRWHHSESLRSGLRGVGHGLTIYAATQSTLNVYDAYKADVSEGTQGAQTAEVVATEAGGWAGALGLGTKGAMAGTAIGGPPGGFIGGLLGGALGYWGASTIVEKVIDFGQNGSREPSPQSEYSYFYAKTGLMPGQSPYLIK